MIKDTPFHLNEDSVINKGYVIKACHHLNMKNEDIDKLLKAIDWAFDTITDEEAEEEFTLNLYSEYTG